LRLALSVQRFSVNSPKPFYMKKITIALCLLVTFSSQAQDKFNPSIKQGTKLNYSAFVNGQPFTCNFSFDSVNTGYLKVGWSVDGYGSGAWIMKNKSLESATKGYWGQPSPGASEEVPDDKSILVFSKAQWDMLQKENKLNFDQQTFTVKTPSEQQQLKLAGKLVDAFFLENPNGTTRIWILNNAAFPVMLKIEGNTLGADLTVNSVE
jgi:hypothetical protein